MNQAEKSTKEATFEDGYNVLIRDGLSPPAWHKKSISAARIDHGWKVCCTCPQFFVIC